MVEARQAQKRYRNVPSAHTAELLKAACKRQKRTVQTAQAHHWRQIIAQALKHNKDIWALERWARLRSHKPPTAEKLPSLRRGASAPDAAQTHEEKAEILAEKFFPNPPADLSDIRDTSWTEAISEERVPIERHIDGEEIAQIIRKTGAWKAPGTDDLLPTGFLKACGKPLFDILAQITNASFALEYFPLRFRSAGVVVIQKPGKPAEALETAGGWRPISLLSSMDKVIETVMAKRIASAAESHSLLPEI